MNIKLKISGVVLLLVGTLFVLLSRPNIDEPMSLERKNAQTMTDAKHESPSADRILNNPPISAQTTSISAAVPILGEERRSVYQRYNNAKNLGALYLELEKVATTNSEALYFMAEITSLCQTVHGAMLENAKARLRSAETPPQRVTALTELIVRCTNVPVKALENDAYPLWNRAAEMGDVRARARRLNTPGIKLDAAAIAQLQEVRELVLSKDPVALQNLGGYFMSRDGKVQWEIPGASGSVSGVDMALAMELAACDYGLDCSDTALEAIAYCGLRGWCDAGGREERIRRNQTSPAQFVNLQAIRDAVARGFATNSWPTGFWSGIGILKGKKP